MRFEVLRSPPLDDNVYILVDEGTREAIVIDPALAKDRILETAKRLGAKVKVILNTHGHADHAADDGPLKEATGAKLGIHEVDAYRLERNAKQPPSYLSSPPWAVKPDLVLKEGSEVKVGATALTVWHTPGHTEGSACFFAKAEGILFSGDTILAGAPGRSDLQGSSPAKMVASLRRLSQLPWATRVFPGHGRATTIADEPWLENVAYPLV